MLSPQLTAMAVRLEESVCVSASMEERQIVDSAAAALELVCLFFRCSLHLNGLCHRFRALLDDGRTKGSFWRDGARGMYEVGLVRIYTPSSYPRISGMSEKAMRLGMKGQAKILTDAEVVALASLIACEDPCDGKLRFVVSWSFEPSSVDALLRGRSLKPVFSNTACFACNYGIIFDVNLALSRVLSKDSLRFELSVFSFEMAHIILPSADRQMTVCGTIVIPGKDCAVVPLMPLNAGAKAVDRNLQTGPVELDMTGCEGLLRGTCLTSIMRITTPGWLKPISIRA